MTRGWRDTRLVAARELRETIRGKAFWIVAVLLVVGSSAGMVVPDLLADDSTPRYRVAVVDGSPSLESALQQAVAAIEGELDVREVPDEATAARQVEDGAVQVGVVTGPDPTILVKADEHERLVGAVRQAISTDQLTSRLETAGLTEGDVQGLLEEPPARVELLDTGGASRQGAAFILSLAMYLLLIMLMMQVANGTAVEKANRISEVLLAIVRPGSLLFGKVLGVGIIGVLTALCAVAPMLVKLAVGGDLPEGIGGALAGGAAWFLLGIALYLVLAGALGALVERQEEAGSVTMPANLVLVGAYLVGGSAPESSAAAVLAYIPLTSPMVMPSRIAVGAASGAEMVISLALSAVAIMVAARLGSVVYQRAIVRTGRRLKLLEVLRSA